jgi:alpha-L-rhamnosidase
MSYMTKLFVFLAAFFCMVSSAFGLTVQRMTCEMQENPLVVSLEKPRFGWQLVSEKPGDAQKAYRILVSSNSEALKNGRADRWDSGKIRSAQSQLVVYAGKPLATGQTYYWSVQVWDAKGKPAQTPSTACFGTAPSKEALAASWIGAITKANSHLPEGRKGHAPNLKKDSVRQVYDAINPLALRSIQLRKSIAISKKVTSAKIYVSGLGHYELNLNGHKVGNSEFTPMWSDYDKTVYYCVYEADTLLNKGENVIGVTLGNGFYNSVSMRYSKVWISFGPPTLFFQMELTYADGSKERILSDKSWKYSLSPITFNNIYGGEDYDACLEQPGWDKPGFNESSWMPVVLQDAPQGLLRPQTAPDIKMMKSYQPQSVKKLEPGVSVLNMGQNLSGYPKIQVQGKRGSTIRLIVGESLSDDGHVTQKRTGGPYFYQYTLKGDGVETWSPKFSYYGFQYIEIDSADVFKTEPGSERPLVLVVQSQFVHNSAEETGSFTCSNDLFNKAHVLIQNAVKSNFQAVFTDCPHREKLGWLEEIHLNGPGLFFNYDLSNFMPKLMQDMADAQNPNGLVPSIAPEYVIFGGDFSDSPEWGASAVIVPWMYYEYYGDASLIKKFYPVMKRYVDYLTTKSTEGIVSHGLGDWYDYGTHVAGYPKNSPVAISATSHYYYCIDYLVRSAKLAGFTEDVRFYSQLKEYVKKAYNKKFFDPKTKQYATGSQYSNAVSLYMGLVDPKDKDAVLKNLVADIRAHGNRLTTGDVGNRYLFQTLADNNLNEVMYEMNNHYDAPGYGFQLKYGVTTLTEQWDPRRGNSWNHFMMGQIDEWFYKTLAGIQPDRTRPGFEHFYIQPTPVGDLSSVHATYKCLYGTIEVDWKKTVSQFELNVRVPVNTTATVVLPQKASSATINGKPVKVKDHSFSIESGDSQIIALN